MKLAFVKTELAFIWELLSLKRKELAFVLGYYYSDYDLATLVHPLAKYTNSFQCFVFQNYKKVKTG